MLNYMIILAILLVFMALKLTKFVGIAIVIALVVILVAKNGLRIFGPLSGKEKRGERKDH